MAHLMGLQEVGALAGPRQLLAEVSVSLSDGDRVGILGPNGAGKSTLLRLLTGAQAPDAGTRTVADGVEFSFVSQSDQMDPRLSGLEVVHPGAAAHEWASSRDNRLVHAGLLEGIDLAAPVGTLSGGQRRRLLLAAGLLRPAQVLALDEPTNHLDVEGVAWLADYLRQRFGGSSSNPARGALVVVTHDRWFLDAVCSRVWEVVPGVDPGGARPQVPGHLEQYDGSYAAYVLARAERARQSAQSAQKRENLLRKELAWLRRGAPARTSKPRFRIEAAENLIQSVPPPRDEVELLSLATARLGKDVLDFENLSLGYSTEAGSRKEIFRDVTWRLAPAQRVGIVGVNGAGKTSALKLLQGTLQPDSGRVKRGKTVKVVTLSQSTQELDQVAQLRVVEAVNEVATTVKVGKKEITASQLVERLGFTRERAWTPVGELSGGERRRLQLMRLLMSEPNVLLLDEPTNDLDTDTLAAIEDLLDGFAGTLVVVSHDRYLLERVTDSQVALLGDGKIRDLPGGIDEYLELRRQSLERTAEVASVKTAETSAAAEHRRLTKEAARIERQLDRANQKAAKLAKQLEQLAAEITADPSRANDLGEVAAQHAQATSEVEDLEAQWLQALEELEALP